MDHSWLFDNEEVEELEAESAEEEEEAELEQRLYAVVHHNDLSQPLPPDLAKHYDIQTTDSGEFEVILKNSLEELQTEECEKVNVLLANQTVTSSQRGESTERGQKIVNNSVDPTSFFENTNTTRNFKKKFRYTDVDLNVIRDEKELKSTINDVTFNYFNFGPAIFKNKNRRFAKIKVPKSFNPCDWKVDANMSFISIKKVGCNTEVQEIVNKMTLALSALNPQSNLSFLADFAHLLYKRNAKIFRKKLRRHAKTNIHMADCTSSLHYNNDLSVEIKKCAKKIQKFYNVDNQNFLSQEDFQIPTRLPNRKNKIRERGSISLNVSPFKPASDSEKEVVDLVSDEEINPSQDVQEESSCEALEDSSTMPEDSKNTENPYLPKKWSKEMIKFYTSPSKVKFTKNFDQFMDNMRKTTSRWKDWKVDPRDAKGVYQRPNRTGKRNERLRKCTNCFERNHSAQNCPKPVRLPTCFLCGELYHTDYSCPNTICWKCGISTNPKDGFERECSTCYYSQFEADIPCVVCADVTHRSPNCPDLWRSFHATTEGDKKVPERVNMNKRRYCCNCAQKGHFSHECAFVLYWGQQTSPFVRNYSAEPSQSGSIDLAVAKTLVNFSTPEGDEFLQQLSDSSQAVIQLNEENYQYFFRVTGTFDQCSKVKSLIQEYVNTRKRKRHEPGPYRKRQRVS